MRLHRTPGSTSGGWRTPPRRCHVDVERIQLSQLDRGSSRSARTACRECRRLVGYRLHRHGCGRAEPADGLPRRPLRGILLSARRQHDLARDGRGTTPRRAHQRGRHHVAAAACPPFAAAPRTRERGARGRTPTAGLHDGFEWFCPECHALLHRVEVHVGNIVDDLPPLFEAFYSSQELRTCDSCGATQPGRHDTA